MATPNVSEFLAHNEAFAQTFDKGHLPMPPKRKALVLACMDARLHPEKVLGLEIGDCHVVRNAGGRASADALRSIAISQRLLGTTEVLVIHHTDCGMLTFSDDQIKQKIREDLGDAAGPPTTPSVIAYTEVPVKHRCHKTVCYVQTSTAVSRRMAAAAAAAAAAANVPAATSGLQDANGSSNIEHALGSEGHAASKASSGDTPDSAVLGTSIKLHKIHQVKMHVAQKCKMGISFWPMFSFKAPDREPQSGTVQVVRAADVPTGMIPTAAAAASNAGSSSNTGKGSIGIPSASESGDSSSSHRSSACEQLLRVNFTREPPDEVSIGAKFLGGIPFPFLSIRTTRLEGIIDPCSGAVRLMFEAAMLAQVGSREPIALPLHTTMTTEPASAFGVTLEGKRLQNGDVTLVSAAEVPKTSSWLANCILWLPTAATALLPMHFEFTE